MRILTPSELADVLTLKYAGAVPAARVRTAVAEADRELPEMTRFPGTRADLLEARARRLLVHRVLLLADAA
jgi:hypothetical protein